MCGVAGAFQTDGKPVSIQTIKRMTDVLHHRGPDGEGYWAESFVGLGHRRLAIIDLSSAGHQPMQTEDGKFVISYNGEIYNFPNLRMELEAKGHRFRSRTDTEVLLKGYAEWGPAIFSRLNGMFAFALWDARELTLTLVRDRYGIKPLYWCFRDRALLFASEIKSLLEFPGFSVGVSPEALSEYFSFQNIFSDRTLFKGVHMLPAGHFLQVRLGDAQVGKPKQYWDFDFREQRVEDERETIEELDRLFEQAVKRQLLSDVEVGAYLSGGMDSGAIVCLAAREHKHLKTFTCGFDLSSASGLELNFDERARSEFLSNLFKTEQYEAVLKAGDMERVMPDLIWHLEDLRVGQSYPNFYISRLASKFVKVVLSGTGGDELFAGYPWRYYRTLDLSDPDHYVQHYYDFWQRLLPDAKKRAFFRPAALAGVPDSLAYDVFRGVFGSRLGTVMSREQSVNASLYFEAKTFLSGLLVVDDKLSMAHSLETRVPFLDNDLVDFAMKVPVRYKLRELGDQPRLNENDVRPKHNTYFLETNDGKLVLRKALTKYLPPDYTTALKQGFSAPDASWFKGSSIEYIRRLLLDPRARIYEYLEFNSVKVALEEHFSGTTNRRLLIWSLLSFEWWNRIFVDGEYKARVHA
ncbi:MAG: asparagine synthase (glutamine-hydrolyzing) [Myxococcales bacterium]|nr:asparagine synthase (glutamine-hydrolyzing) [Myxococcales bacterium]